MDCYERPCRQSILVLFTRPPYENETFRWKMCTCKCTLIRRGVCDLNDGLNNYHQRWRLGLLKFNCNGVTITNALVFFVCLIFFGFNFAFEHFSRWAHVRGNRNEKTASLKFDRKKIDRFGCKGLCTHVIAFFSPYEYFVCDADNINRSYVW